MLDLFHLGTKFVAICHFFFNLDNLNKIVLIDFRDKPLILLEIAKPVKQRNTGV